MRLPSRTAVLVILLASAAPLSRAQSESESPAEAAEQARPRTLFQRAGGSYALARVVDVFVDGLFTDPVIHANAVVRRELRPTHKAGLKFQITTLLCQETGGPCKYAGRTLRESHVNLGITEREWNATTALFKKALVAAQVPPTERAELMNLLGTSKDDVVRKGR
jgi:hemoglobin